MSNLHDHTSGSDLLFPGDLSGVQFRLKSLSLHNNDDEEKPNLPNEDVHGNWVKVETEQLGEAYMSAPGEFIEELQRLNAASGDLFKITRCVKSGPKQTDPYEVNIDSQEPDQVRL